MSIRKIIHNALEGKIKATSKFNWIDVWKAQVGKAESYPFNFPAAFISTKRITWQDMVMNVQEGKVEIDVWLFFEEFGDTFEGATDKDTSFEDIETVELIANDLQWTEEDPFKELTLIAEEDISERYQRPAFKLTFETILYKQIN